MPSRSLDIYRSAPEIAEMNGVEPATIRKWARRWGVSTKAFGRKVVYNVREIDEAARAAAAKDADAPTQRRRRRKPTPQKGARPASTVEELDALFAQLPS